MPQPPAHTVAIDLPSLLALGEHASHLMSHGTVIVLSQDSMDDSTARLSGDDAVLPLNVRVMAEGGKSIWEQSAAGGEDAKSWVELRGYASHLHGGTPAPSQRTALSWWARSTGRGNDSIVVCSADMDLLNGPWKAVVGREAVLRHPDAARAVWQQRQGDAATGRLYFATGANGILDGLRWFRLLPPESSALPPSVLGSHPVDEATTQFRIWAPKQKRIDVVVGGENYRLRSEQGVHSGRVAIGPGADYQLALNYQQRRPDPTAKFQPTSVHDHSRVTATCGFPWTDEGWGGVAKRDLIIYELHLGAFSESGDYRGAIARIPYLKSLGITAIELLPLAQTPGRWNWGYDGVGLYAPNHNYGSPDELKLLVDTFHREGIAVILDVVYNHLGPEGNYLAEFGPYFSRKHHTPWGGAVNFDGWQSAEVRRWVVDNAVYWLDEYHFDGLRLDAVHFMFDDSEVSILQEVRRATAEYEATVNRTIHLIAESNMYDHELAEPADGLPYDAMWSDCIMHSIYSLGAPDVRLTHRDYDGAGDLAEALRDGYLYEGPHVRRVGADEKQRRHGNDRDYLQSLVVALQTHDSVGNHPHGKRLHQLASPEFQRAAATLILLYPSVPMLFMGEESGADAPFPFFADFGDPGLRQRVDQGRAREYPQHQRDGAVAPSDPAAFFRAKCDLDGPSDPHTLDWYRRLLEIRRDGVSQGWLDVRGFAVEAMPNEHVFRLTYHSVQLGMKIEAAVCLGEHSATEYAATGVLLANSRDPHATSSEEQTFRLEPNQALITMHRE